MTTTKNAAKAAKTTRKANANEVSKSSTTKRTTKGGKAKGANSKELEQPQQQVVVNGVPVSNEVANMLENSTNNEVVKHDLDEATAKAVEKARKLVSKETKAALKLTKGEILGVANWLKVFKKNFSPSYQSQIDKKWATLCVEVKRAGSYYLEEIVTKDKKGNTTKGSVVHMVEFRPATKVAEIGRKINVTELRYLDEDPIAIKSVKDLTIERKVVKYEVLKETFNGVEWTRKIERVVSEKLRPEEILTFSYGEFAKRIKLAMQVVFPNGFEQ